MSNETNRDIQAFVQSNNWISQVDYQTKREEAVSRIVAAAMQDRELGENIEYLGQLLNGRFSSAGATTAPCEVDPPRAIDWIGNAMNAVDNGMGRRRVGSIDAVERAMGIDISIERNSLPYDQVNQGQVQLSASEIVAAYNAARGR